MSNPSWKDTMAQAKARGLKLSSDGKSWVPVNEPVTKKPSPKPMETNGDKFLQYSQLLVFSILGIICLASFGFGVIDGDLDNIVNGSFLFFQLFIALFLLTPIYFHLRRPSRNNDSINVKIGQPIIFNEQALRQQKQQKVMKIFGGIGMAFLLVFIVSLIVVIILFILFIEFLNGLGSL
tara:strand:- start:763 stop:1299 length:537 start_codon:yes stop_codon:yes gene_type:complete